VVLIGVDDRSGRERRPMPIGYLVIAREEVTAICGQFPALKTPA
jgi:hypothetical protein